MSLPSEIRETRVPSGSVRLWWLGQAGFMLKSPNGKVLVIDPYLTDYCSEIGKKVGVRMDRLAPPPILPGELECDCLAFTHSRPDHLDPETFNGSRSMNSTCEPSSLAITGCLPTTRSRRSCSARIC